MKMTQVYEILNTMTGEITGQTGLVKEDLSNIVDIGREIMNTDGGLDHFVRALPDHVGRVVFVDRVYAGRAPSVLMDGWEYGAILEKIRADLPEAEENESWELEDRASYDTNIFYKPKISVKFFSDRVTFEVPISITERQVKSAFSDAQQMNGLMSLIYTAVENSLTVKLDALIMRTINAGIAETVYDAMPGGTYTGAGGVRAINLLYAFNRRYSKNLTAAEAVTDPDFLRFAVYHMARTAGHMSNMSRLFNVGGTDKFTPADRLKAVMLDDFRAAAEVYLYDANGQLKTDYLKLPNADGVSFWQGSGTGYDFGDVSKISVTTPSGHDVTVTGVLAVLFDRDALGVSNLDRRTTAKYNERAEFWSQWHKADAGYFLDLNENMVVFYVA